MLKKEYKKTLVLDVRKDFKLWLKQITRKERNNILFQCRYYQDLKVTNLQVSLLSQILTQVSRRRHIFSKALSRDYESLEAKKRFLFPCMHVKLLLSFGDFSRGERILTGN